MSSSEIPLCLVAVWAAVEVGLAIYDAYDVYTTISDPDASGLEKGASIVGAAAGILLPGGGYSSIDEVAEFSSKQLLLKGGDNSSKLLPAISKSTADEILDSATRQASNQIQEGARAIQKKLGHAEKRGITSAFDGIKPTQENAMSIIKEILDNPKDVVVGKLTTDVYDSTGRGVRYNTETGEFIGFLEEQLRTR